jgi:uncharacterized membrane protein
VSDPAARLAHALEAVLIVGLLISATLLAGGVLLGSGSLLRAGTVLLILTPVARVVAVTIGFVHAREWDFALISLAVLGVLASSAWVGLGMAR